MGGRQGGVGEASSLCFFGRGHSEDASPTRRNPLGRGRLAVFPRCSLFTYRFRLDMVVGAASPARTALKNSQLTCDERHAYFGDRTFNDHSASDGWLFFKARSV